MSGRSVMPRHPDWSALLRETVLSLDGAGMTGLYSVEWKGAGSELVAEFHGAIEAEPNGFKRFLMRLNAGLYGLTRRLAPARRLLFAAAVLLALWAILHLLGSSGWPDVAVSAVIELAIAVVLFGFLIGMELVDKLRFRDELVMARELQAEIVPQILPASPGFDLGAFHRVANTVGGDLYEFTPLPGGRLAVLFGDASGHGMAAGLVMAVAHTAWRVQLATSPDPVEVARTLSHVLSRGADGRGLGGRSFFAGIPILLEPDGSFVAVVAGHPPILRVDARGKVVERIGTGAYPFGIKLGAIPEPCRGRLDPGDLLLFHSDGLTEARNGTGEEFGDRRVEESLRRTAGATAGVVARALEADLTVFLGRVPADDDVSVAVIRKVAQA